MMVMSNMFGGLNSLFFSLLRNTENVPIDGMDKGTTQIWMCENVLCGGHNAQ